MYVYIARTVNIFKSWYKKPFSLTQMLSVRHLFSHVTLLRQA
uniref:Uncharacterized protein n=1 Tax=Anguilla anguilla TaxID=7936 RepID=A0A0E9QK26_ANGAN